MAAKKSNLEETLIKDIQDEEITVEGENEESLSSLDLLWKLAFHKLNEWAKCADHRDEVFYRQFSESVKRNQGNIKAIAEQFTKEFTEWEKTAQDEFLMSTTTLQHFFPIWSYEEMNAQMDQIKKTVLSPLRTPYKTMVNSLAIEKYVEMMEHYMKKGRLQYINTVKQAGNQLYGSQKEFVKLFTTPFKEIIFPLNKYMEKTKEPIKS
ncbi:hypothetical protein [Neobacillus drentensis]|uniref:hypothetical protein n=1 Tax=Neobacillus drentensis TaxID=220684 RepID=UPI002FFEF694